MATHTTLSVRGEARRTVAPDAVMLSITLAAVPAPRADALAWLRAAQDRLVTALTGLGGEPLTADTDRSLTWSFGSVGVHDEHDFDETTGRHGRTGRVVASTSAVITVRDLDRLPDVSEAIGVSEHLSIDGVGWQVDPDNPAWPIVRSDAIAAALAKARDYAAALGGTVISVEHVADTGLLTNTERQIEGGWAEHGAVAAYAGSSSGSGSGGLPTLDPVPQEIHAVVEARVTAEIDPASGSNRS